MEELGVVGLVVVGAVTDVTTGAAATGGGDSADD